MKVHAEHNPLCDKVFTSKRGAQAGGFGLLRCQCGKILFYQTPDSRG